MAPRVSVQTADFDLSAEVGLWVTVTCDQTAYNEGETAPGTPAVDVPSFECGAAFAAGFLMMSFSSYGSWYLRMMARTPSLQPQKVLR